MHEETRKIDEFRQAGTGKAIAVSLWGVQALDRKSTRLNSSH